MLNIRKTKLKEKVVTELHAVYPEIGNVNFNTFNTL